VPSLGLLLADQENLAKIVVVVDELFHPMTIQTF
jgi:hypothetical protein